MLAWRLRKWCKASRSCLFYRRIQTVRRNNVQCFVCWAKFENCLNTAKYSSSKTSLKAERDADWRLFTAHLTLKFWGANFSLLHSVSFWAFMILQQHFISTTQNTKLKDQKHKAQLVEHAPMTRTETHSTKTKEVKEGSTLSLHRRSAWVEISVVVVVTVVVQQELRRSARRPLATLLFTVLSSHRSRDAVMLSARKLFASGQPSGRSV